MPVLNFYTQDWETLNNTPLWLWAEGVMKRTIQRYGYHEIRLPILEPLSLFQHGDALSLPVREAYGYLETGKEPVAVRPEGTSGCIQAVVSRGVSHQNPQRLWYLGPMFQCEKSDSDHFRQIHQLGVEAFGMAGPELGAELIFLSEDILQALGARAPLTLHVNSLGTPQERQAYEAALRDYLAKQTMDWDADSLRRLALSPLRLFHSHRADIRALMRQGPSVDTFLGQESIAHHQQLCDFLDSAQLEYVYDPYLIGGLHYYTRTFFEWRIKGQPETHAICGGGRYDHFTQFFSDRMIPAAGFAFEIEHLMSLLRQLRSDNEVIFAPDIVVAAQTPELNVGVVRLGHELRRQCPELRVRNDLIIKPWVDLQGVKWRAILQKEGLVEIQHVPTKTNCFVPISEALTTMMTWKNTK